MLSEIALAIASHLMEVNAHKVSPENIGAAKKEDLFVTKSAIAIGSGWLSLDVSRPVICRRQLNFIQLSEIVVTTGSTGFQSIIGTVPAEVAPSHLVNVASTVFFSESGTKLCSLLITDTGQISLAFPLLQEDILWLSLSELMYLAASP